MCHGTEAVTLRNPASSWLASRRPVTLAAPSGVRSWLSYAAGVAQATSMPAMLAGATMTRGAFVVRGNKITQGLGKATAAQTDGDRL